MSSIIKLNSKNISSSFPILKAKTYKLLVQVQPKLRKRYGVKWLASGDQNTKFNHQNIQVHKKEAYDSSIKIIPKPHGSHSYKTLGRGSRYTVYRLYPNYLDQRLILSLA